MQKVIELTIESVDGEVDCRLESSETEGENAYSAVILYPHITNGIPMSKVYEHELRLDTNAGAYIFSEDAAIHPSVRALGKELSNAILKKGKKA